MSRSTAVTVIEPGRAALHYWRDLWQYRELFMFLAWRDVVVRYKQTAIGVAWAVLRPAVAALAFTIVFGKLAKLPSEGVPYALLVAAAILPWQFFASSFSDASNSLIDNSNLISKVYFPRIIIPASAVIVGVVDLLFSGAILAVLMAWYRVIPDWRVLSLPLFVALAFGIAVGAGLWFASLNVKYRDFRYIVPFVVQFGLYVSPVGFSSAIVPEHWRLVYSLNPMVGVIDGFRWALLGGSQALFAPGLAISCVVTSALLLSGIAFFRRTEKSFADII